MRISCLRGAGRKGRLVRNPGLLGRLDGCEGPLAATDLPRPSPGPVPPLLPLGTHSGLKLSIQDSQCTSQGSRSWMLGPREDRVKVPKAGWV